MLKPSTRAASRRISRLFATVAACALSLPSYAQEEAKAPDEASEEVVVTAQKRAQDPLDVGVNVSAAGAADLRRKRVEQVTDFVAALPNVDVKENSPGILPVITIRGVGLNDFSATNNPSAGVYIDEVYLSSLALMNADLFDIERMEALKGPQGTLYGRNSTAGAINILAARPNLNGFSGRAAASYGNFNTADLEAWFNVPVSETFALRFSGKFIDQNEGFYFNQATGRDFGRRQVLLGRAQARWQTETLDVLLKVEGQRARSEAGAGAFFGLLPPAVPVAGLVCPGDPRCTDFFGYSDTDGDPFTGAYSVDPTYNIDQFSATLRTEADLGGVTLTSVTGYIDFDRQWGADTDTTPLRQTDFIERDDIWQFSQELRLSGETDRLNWLAGLFYSKDSVEGRYDGSLQDLFNTTYLTTWNQTAQSAAAFGNLEYAVTDDLSLVGGLRYTWEQKDNVSANVDLATGCPNSLLSGTPCGTPLTLAAIDATIDDRNWSWKVGLNWKPNDETLVYASISQGVKSGGFFSGVATNPGQLIPYLPESLVSYEVGLKQRFRDSGLSYSAAAFYYDYSDVQTFIRDESGGLPVQRLGNVSEARIYGLDFDLQYAPPSVEGLVLNIGLGLLDTELGAFPSTAGIVPKGNKLPDAPELTFLAGVAYEVDVSTDWALRLQSELRYSADQEKDALNDPIVRAESYWVWNGRVAFLSTEGWEVALWGKNIADERYVTQGVNQLPLGYGYRVYGAPRTFGLSVSRSF